MVPATVFFAGAAIIAAWRSETMTAGEWLAKQTTTRGR